MLRMESQNHEQIWTPETLMNPHTQNDKGVRVRRMFNAIAGRYDLANTLISLGRANGWRKHLMAMVRETELEPARVLDLCCGTGDMLELINAQYPNSSVIGVDFAENMLFQARGRNRLNCLCADAENLPLADGQFDLVTCAFGLRNFQSLEGGLNQTFRITSPSGVLAILEFQTPRRTILRPLFQIYFNYVLPMIGAMVTRSRGVGAYEYLPRSVQCWHDGNFLLQLIKHSGFRDIRVCQLCLGAVWAIVARK